MNITKQYVSMCQSIQLVNKFKRTEYRKKNDNDHLDKILIFIYKLIEPHLKQKTTYMYVDLSVD